MAKRYGIIRNPKKVCAYHSVVASIQNLFLRPGFEEQINEWRKRKFPADSFFDKYDGEMWTSIRDLDKSEPFVEHRRSLLLTLNVDWFRPFRGHGASYSCSAIYLTVNNLPRAVRYKKENAILVGLMPGLKEPKTYEINHYLRPLVKKLQELYKGKQMKTHLFPETPVTVRADLLMVACDTPAGRKVPDFTAANRSRACFKGDRTFIVTPETNNRIDLSGFDVENWILRKHKQNNEKAKLWRDAININDCENIQKDCGIRWTELYELGYSDLVRCTIVDPMHNLFLGMAKRLADYWVDADLLTKSQLTFMADMTRGATRLRRCHRQNRSELRVHESS